MFMHPYPLQFNPSYSLLWLSDSSQPFSIFHMFCFRENVSIFVHNTPMPLSNSLGFNDKFNPLERKWKKKLTITTVIPDLTEC